MVRTIVFYSYFWVTLLLTTPICFLYLLASLVGLRKFFSRPMRWIIATWAKSAIWVAGIRMDVRGLEKIPDENNVCFIANHQGDMDVIGLLSFAPRLVGFIAKSQGRYVPVLNIWLAAMGCVFIDRKNVKRARLAIERGVRNLKLGFPMAIFPEGTRSRKHEMGPFRNGSFKLPTIAEATIVPITIDGSWRIWEERMRIIPGPISFIIHEPVRTAGMSVEQKKALPEQIRAIIASALD